MKNKFIKIFIFALVAMLAFGAVSASAFESYDTYTYSIDGVPLDSPAAYTTSPQEIYNSTDMGLTTKFGGTKIKSSSDIATDEEGRVYVTDPEGNRVVILDKHFKAVGVISEYVNENGKVCTLKSPRGVFATNPKISSSGEDNIYVADTGNKKIVVFDGETFEYVRTIEKPSDDIVDPDAYSPESVAVDLYGRIFVASPAMYEGIMVLSSEGDFAGYIGAQKVTLSAMDAVWRRFQQMVGRQETVAKMSASFNNITVDEDGFVYATINFTDQADLNNQLATLKSKAATYSPVKKLNATGKEIMKRNGFFDPSGEVGVLMADQLSKIIDVAIGPEGTWSILDSSRSRLFTYNGNGDLLFAFGDMGDQCGNGENLRGIAYQQIDGVNYILALDNAIGGSIKITRYSPTPYCDTILAAIKNENEYNYSVSIDYWQDVLTKNNNFDLAYIGIGKALFNQGKYEEAKEMLSSAFETAYWSKAFAEQRKDVIAKYMLPIVIAVIIVLWLFFKFLGWAKKKNKATSLKVGRKTYWEELIYAFHLVFHPFDGFWDLKHEKRGSVRAASTIIGLTILAFIYQSIGQGYTFNPRSAYTTVFVQILSIGVPVILWTVSNWCLTTLFDGEGSFKDIYIATGYSLAPLPLFVMISTILTNVLSASEGSIPTMLITIAFVWVVILVFFGTLVTHDYTLNKNLITVLGTIVAAAIIMFVAILFSSLVVKMVAFLISLITEIGNRIL